MGIVVERYEDLWIHAEGSQEELDMSVSVDEDFESYPKRSLTPYSLWPAGWPNDYIHSGKTHV
jgi:hypothetical protein